MEQRATHQRYFDQRISGDTVFVLPGYHYVVYDEEIPISTLLGSCVSACIRDISTGAGGLNHFLLPESSSSGDDAQSARYGVHAMEVLINELLKSGCHKKDLEAKIFGGGQVINTSSMEAVGYQNGEFVKNYLNSEGIPITAEDLGGEVARRIYFYPASGKVSVLRIKPTANDQITQAEVQLRKQVVKTPNSGGVELF